MALGRVSVPLTTIERQALITIAELECRDPREQLRYMLRTEAQRLGLIPAGEQKKAVHGSDEQTRDDQDSANAPES